MTDDITIIEDELTSLSPTAEDTPSNVSITPKPSEVLTTYVKVVTGESRHYMELINSAKTATKKKYYQKKLRANNQILAKLLPLYERQKTREIAAEKVINPPAETPVDTPQEVVDNVTVNQQPESE